MVGILQADIFTNKTALITGAASGIGRGLALHAAKLQMNVVLMDLNADGLNETHSLMAECPSMIIQCDVSNLEDFSKAKEKIEVSLVQFISCLITQESFWRVEPGKLIEKTGNELLM
jgi:NAD(P)-dependent dehydrogenase (short-subunit alcohol dehydrogenase family)